MQDNDYRSAWNIAKTLHKKSSRDETGLFLIEGRREIDLAAKHGVEIVKILDRSNTSAKNMERISYRGEIVAVAKMAEKSLHDYEVPDNPLIIVLDGLEKPGNIGAIIRTADAAGVSAVLICGEGDGNADLGNPNLVRASLGAVFCLPVFCVGTEEAAAWLKQLGIPVVVATPEAERNYFEYDFSNATAVVVGSEADGVSKYWKTQAHVSVTLPMTGAVNSLNVSASAAVLIYEAVRRRHHRDT